MAEMYLKVNADFGNLIKLKQKIDELTTKLQGMDKAANPKEFKQVEKQLQQFTEEFNRAAHVAAIANKEDERAKHSIKSYIYDNNSNTEKTKGHVSDKGFDNLLRSLMKKTEYLTTWFPEIEKKFDVAPRNLQNNSNSENTDKETEAPPKDKKKVQSTQSTLNLQEFKNSLDLESVINYLDLITTEQIKKLISQIESQLPEISKKLTPKDLKTICDDLDKLYKKFAEREPIDAAKQSLKNYKDAIKEVKKAEEEYNRVIADSTKTTQEKKEAEEKLTEAQNNRKLALKNLSNRVNEFGTRGKEWTDVATSLKNTLPAIGINISDDIGNVLSGVDQIFSSLTSIDLTKPASVITSAFGVIGGLGKTISSILGKHKTQKDTERMKAVTDAIAQTNDAINKKLEKRIQLIKKSTAAEASNLNELTQKDILKQKDYLNQQFGSIQNNWLFAKKGKHNNLTYNDIMRRFNLNNLSDFAKWWDNGGYNDLLAQGFGIRDKDKVDSIVSNWNKLGDAAKNAEIASKEAATGITFDGFKDKLDSLVTQADLTFSNISNSFEDNMSHAILNMVKSKYLTKELEKWYDQFAKDMASGGELTKNEANNLREYYEKIATNANNMYKEAMNVAGINFNSDSSSQQSTKGAYQAMSQDTGDKLEARNTAIHMTTERMDNKLLTISNDVRDIRNHLLDVNEPIKQSSSQIVEAKSGDNNKGTSYDDMLNMNDSSMKASELIKESFQQMVDLKLGNNTITQSSNMLEMNDQIMKMSELTLDNFQHMEEIRNIQLNSYYVLKDINKNTQELYQMNERLGQMNDKLSRL